jgi:spore maturation protein CgeB
MKCDLAFVGHRLPDRERRVEQFFFAAAEMAPDFSFLLGGEGWGSRSLPSNVRWIGHVGTGDHNRINCSARMVLNINRESMANVGFSPPTRVFEAAGAGACLITDSWTGIAEFFEQDREILIAESAEDVVRFLRQVPVSESNRIGAAMRGRALREHTYSLRAEEVHNILQRAALKERRDSLQTPKVDSVLTDQVAQ